MTKKIFTGAAILGVASILSRALGVVRDFLFSEIFGATGGIGIFDIDTYYAAFRIPDTIFNLLVYGTISTAFVPLFTKHLRKSDKTDAWAFASNVLNSLILLLVIFSFIFFIFSKPLLIMLFPGFSPEKIETTTQLMRIMLLSPIIFGISSFAQSIQNSFKKFLTYALAPVVYNLGIIIATAIWGREHGVYAITYGVILGACLHLLIQIPTLIKLGFRYQPIFEPSNKDLKQLVKMVIPRMLGVSVAQVNLIFDSFLASMLFTGSLAIFNYAYNLNSLPLGVIGISFAVASFALLSELIHEEKVEEFKKEISRNFSTILMLVIPSAVGLIIFRSEIVSIILGGSAFRLEDKILTANTLAFFSIGLFAHSLIPLLGRCFYAMHNTKTPFYISVLTFFCNIGFSLTFVYLFKLNIYGLALSNALSGIINFSLLLYFLKRKIGVINFPLKNIANYIVAAAVMSVALLAIKQIWVSQIVELSSFINTAIFLLFNVPLGVAIYFGYLKLFKINFSFRKN